MKIILKNVRVSFLNVFEPRGFNGQAPKYGCQIIMPADHPQMPELLSAVLTAAKEKFPNKVKGDKFPMALKNPIRDGAERAEDYPEYAGQVFFNVTASEKRKPVVLRPARDAEGKLITQTRDDGSKVPVLEKMLSDDGTLYSGCYCNATLNTFGFEASGNRGVSLGLNGLLYLRPGERLGGSGGDAMGDLTASVKTSDLEEILSDGTEELSLDDMLA